MSFNEYINELNNIERFQGYETLENFYFTHSVLLKEFIGIDSQFKMWLDKNTYNANAVASLLPELPNLISNLSEVRFKISELDNYEDNLILSKLIRYIKNVMTFSEVKKNLEKLILEIDAKQNFINETIRKIIHLFNSQNFNTYFDERPSMDGIGFKSFPVYIRNPKSHIDKNFVFYYTYEMKRTYVESNFETYNYQADLLDCLKSNKLNEKIEFANEHCWFLGIIFRDIITASKFKELLSNLKPLIV